MNRFLNSKIVQIIVAPALFILGSWLGSYLWTSVYNGPLQAQVDELRSSQAATNTAADALKDDVHYIRDRVDAIYDRLPAKNNQ